MEYVALAVAILSLLLHALKAKKPDSKVVAEAAVLVDAAKQALPAPPSA